MAALKWILAFIAGGALWSGITAIYNAKQVRTNAKIANMKAPVEVENMRVAGMEVLTKNLQADNQVLRADRDYWKGEYEKMKTEVERLSAELERQEERNRTLRKHIEDLQAHMDAAEKRSPAAAAGREDLYDDTHVAFPNH